MEALSGTMIWYGVSFESLGECVGGGARLQSPDTILN